MAFSEALAEIWGLYCAGTLLIIGRTVCRWRLAGFDNFKPDDYLVWLAWVTYTVMTVAAHIVGGAGDLHALTPEQRKNLTPEEAAPLILGTQWFCAGVATYVSFIWMLKLNMLFLYQRIVNGLWAERFIKPTMGLVVATYVAIMMILFCSCRPYHRMWIVYPDQGAICKPQATINLVPALVMNILTDLCIMAIPAPVIIPVKTTLWRKVLLLTIFGAGFFIMTAAILRVVFVLVYGNGPTAALWSCREDAVAILVGQAPMLRPLFTRNFYTGKSKYGSTSLSSYNKDTRNKGVAFEMGQSSSKGGFKRKDPYSCTAIVGPSDSTEKIMENDAGGSGNATSTDIEKGAGGAVEAAPKSPAFVINVSVSNRIDVEERADADWTGGHNSRQSGIGRSGLYEGQTHATEVWARRSSVPSLAGTPQTYQDHGRY